MMATIRNTCYIIAACLILLTFIALTGSLLGAGELEITWEDPVKVATGDAYVGPWRMNESEFHYVDDPTVAVNEQGTIGVAWAHQTRQDIFFQRFGADGNKQLEEPVNVSRSPDIFSWLPRMVITDDDPGQIYLLWQEIIFSGGSHGGETFFARSTDGGKSFNEPLNLSNSTAGDGKGRLNTIRWHNGSLDLVMGPAGNLYAAWTEYEGRLLFSRSADRGASFTEPVHVAGDNHTPARGPSLAVGTDGAVYLAWTNGEDAAADIRLAESKDLGRSFSTSRIIHDSNGHADAPKLAVDSEDIIHVVYGESPAGPLKQYHIRYSRSDDQGHTFSQPKDISRPQSQQYDSVNFPALSMDGMDNLYVIWEIFPEELNGHSLGLGFTHSNDGGQTFAAPSVIPGSSDAALGINGSLQGSLMRKLSVNETGTTAVVNSTFKRGDTSHIWLVRGQLLE